MMGKGKSSLKIFFGVSTVPVVITTAVFAFLNSVPISIEDGNSTINAAPSIFYHTTEDLGIKYPNVLSPPDWVFIIIWPLIYLWNICSALYMFASLFMTIDRSPVMREPAMMPVTSLIFWNLLWLCALAWLFSYDREIMGLATFFIMASALCGYLCLGFSYKSYYQDILILEEHHTKMLWIVRILIHNGFAIVTTWLTVGWKLAFATVITYADSRNSDKTPADFLGSLTAEDSGTIILSILLFEIILWFILENFVFEKYCRYTLTIYPVLIFALTGVFWKTFTLVAPGLYTRNTVISLCGLILTCIAFVARVGMVIYRHRNKARYA